jgi:hypothetical protein
MARSKRNHYCGAWYPSVIVYAFPFHLNYSYYGTVTLASTAVANNVMSQQQQQKQQLDPTEVELGISIYLSDAPGFSAVSKGRFSDFLVHEGTVHTYWIQQVFYGYRVSLFGRSFHASFNSHTNTTCALSHLSHI